MENGARLESKIRTCPQASISLIACVVPQKGTSAFDTMGAPKIGPHTVVRPIGRNDAGIPEDQVCEIVIPFLVPDGTIFHDPKTDEYFGSDGKKLELSPKNGEA